VKRCFEEEVDSPAIHPEASRIASGISFAREMDDNEANIIFYVAGYIAHSLDNCEGCSNLLRQEKPCPPVEVEEKVSDGTAIFFNHISRGGLKCPSSALYEVCVLGYMAFSEIKNTPDFIVLVRSPNSALLFADAVLLAIEAEDRHHFPAHCTKNHSSELLMRRCLLRLFNVMAKKLIADLATESRDSDSQFRKILKLSSDAK
jgi:hypothetical protein